MKNISNPIMFILLLLLLVSCNDDLNGRHKTNDKANEQLTMGDMPNEHSKYDTIYTVNSVDNIKLINELKEKLEKADFSFAEQTAPSAHTYYDCEENKVNKILGNGIRKYFARSKKPEKGTKNYYPDFMIWVYEFPSKDIAKKNYEILEKAQNSAGRFCNGKSPVKLILNGNEVFHLGTRAEMFRTYIEKYGEIIKATANN